MNNEQKGLNTNKRISTEYAKQLLDQHEEAVVIYLDKDVETEGEHKISVLTKLASKSKLSAVLEQILLNLQRTRDAKIGGQFQAKTTATKKERNNKRSQKHKSNGPTITLCSNG